MPNSIVEDDATTRDANVLVTTISSTGSSQLSSSSGQVSTFGTANQEENIPDVTPSPPGARTLFTAPAEDERRTNFLSTETPTLASLHDMVNDGGVNAMTNARAYP